MSSRVRFTCNLGYIIKSIENIHSKFESVKFSEIQWKFTEFQPIHHHWFFFSRVFHWNSVNFHWISENFTDSKLESRLGKVRSTSKIKALGHVKLIQSERSSQHFDYLIRSRSLLLTHNSPNLEQNLALEKLKWFFPWKYAILSFGKWPNNKISGF